jgi:hypothetical protein
MVLSVCSGTTVWNVPNYQHTGICNAVLGSITHTHGTYEQSATYSGRAALVAEDLQINTECANRTVHAFHGSHCPAIVVVCLECSAYERQSP